ncbi:MAG: NADH-quinone oxidoreductase subunit C [Actinobacteria bacterium]|jgi:NADH-quinone oxidoreductase subunit C|nr:NADH-quinone oxidoreductase subunit C [Actinomycetota bacterium]
MSSEVTTTPATLHGCLLGESRGQSVLFVPRQSYIATMKKLVDDGYEMCVDLTAVDFLTHNARNLPEGVAPERFEVVVNLLSLSKRERLRVRVQISESDPRIDSLFDLYPGTEAMEREVFDMFGISFTGHPDLTRILMPEDWQGHPLRKDYAQGRIPVQFKGAAS